MTLPAVLGGQLVYLELKDLAVSHVDTPWSRLAARTARGLLSRKGASYEDLAAKLCAMGVQESVRGAESKIQRGSYRLAFFLQILQAVNSEYPPQWRPFLGMDNAWETTAKHILLHELSAHGLDLAKLASRLTKLGIRSESSTIESQVSSGEFPFTLVLQLSLVYPIAGMDRFVDHSDIERAASEATGRLFQTGGIPA